jgi:purine-binding chemotaxis protein CheW
MSSTALDLARNLPLELAPRRPTQQLQRPVAMPGDYLSFFLDGEEYGLDILSVQEIRPYEETPTRLQGADAHVVGVVDLRGIIVPIVDLRRKFGMPALQQQAKVPVFIVLQGAGQTTGLLVDAVNEVVTLAAAHIKPITVSTPSTQTHMQGIASVEGRMLVLLSAASFMNEQGAAARLQ